MLTQCPGCQTVFRVTSTILRAAHGQVRCGRCNTQFDAIEQLLDGDENAIAATQTELRSLDADHAPQAAPDDDIYSGTAVTHEDIVLEGNRIEISGVYPGPQFDNDDAVSHTRTIIEEIDFDRTDLEMVFESAADTELDDIEDALSETALASALTSLDEFSATSVDDNPLDAPLAAPPTSSLSSRNPWLSPRPNNTASSIDESILLASKPPHHWPWAAASVLLSVLLVVQLLHHYRQDLARHPSFGPQLTRLYATLGQTLTPQWQVADYSIKQWGIVSDPQDPGTLRVRASVTNGAGFAQPYPLLQLSLEDRFGNKVGHRAFKPEEYLSNKAQATRLLAAGSAANIDLAIVDPGSDAVGFQFDTCLNLSSGLRCTHDPQ